MGFYHLGFVYIPISFIGSMINIISFYCLLKYRARSILGFRNQERLLMALNISDFLQCAFIMPWKAIAYITQPGLRTKPMSVLYFDCIFFWSSSWIILCIAVNNYIKISRPSQYDQILSKGRLIVLMATTQVFSIGSPALLFVNLYIGIVVNGLTFLLFLILLPLFYILIIREMRLSRRRTENNRVGIQQQNNKVDIEEVEDGSPETTSKKNINVAVEVNQPVQRPTEEHINAEDENDPEAIRSVQPTLQSVSRETNEIKKTSSSIVERRVVKNVLILVAVFYGCFLALLLLGFAYIFSGGKQKRLDPIKFAVVIFSLRAIINPGIYVFTNRTYRDIVKTLIPRYLRRRRNRVSDTGNRRRNMNHKVHSTIDNTREKTQRKNKVCFSQNMARSGTNEKVIAVLD